MPAIQMPDGAGESCGSSLHSSVSVFIETYGGSPRSHLSKLNLF